MPISMVNGQVFVPDGEGGMRPIPPQRIEITVPGVEHVVIEDDDGIIIETDPETGMPIVHAEHMTITSEGKKKPNFPRLLERLFPRKEK